MVCMLGHPKNKKMEKEVGRGIGERTTKTAHPKTRIYGSKKTRESVCGSLFFSSIHSPTHPPTHLLCSATGAGVVLLCVVCRVYREEEEEEKEEERCVCVGGWEGAGAGALPFQSFHPHTQERKGREEETIYMSYKTERGGGWVGGWVVVRFPSSFFLLLPFDM